MTIRRRRLGRARIPLGGVTCCSMLGARAHPPYLPLHGPNLRLAGVPGAQATAVLYRDRLSHHPDDLATIVDAREALTRLLPARPVLRTWGLMRVATG